MNSNIKRELPLEQDIKTLEKINDDTRNRWKSLEQIWKRKNVTSLSYLEKFMKVYKICRPLINIQEIENKNKSVREVISRIKKLKWHEYIIFNSVRYGVPYVVNGIHRENDCYGKMETWLLPLGHKSIRTSRKLSSNNGISFVATAKCTNCTTNKNLNSTIYFDQKTKQYIPLNYPLSEETILMLKEINFDTNELTFV